MRFQELPGFPATFPLITSPNSSIKAMSAIVDELCKHDGKIAVDFQQNQFLITNFMLPYFCAK